ncbi:class I SAM-dependent methyltransferase [Thiothrix subterranea]|uniref:Class I SAM-dependent methyltransferase n=1 Tax=Thiothrix subterranea TaxID=2735563 RepID=A0AA51MR66_9GAMM|nr:class I SAM-dependent methyltransferase [Thiothrix subterranea]WML88575.1 class I SAM-dependent methyltransferase [Thiothrix subterranea]
MNYQELWSTQKSSGHRANDANFWQKKALEHAFVLGNDKNETTIDIGCGAGELLEYLLNSNVNVTEAIDFSETMLQEAKERLKHSSIAFSSPDTLSHLSNTSCATWVACESINQYLDAHTQGIILDTFKNNSHAKSLYLFDTVCPTRFMLWNKTKVLNYVSPSTRLTYLRHIYGFANGFMKSIFMPNKIESCNIGVMGYAFSPQFFIKQAISKGLNIEIISSMYYEYRYHIIVKKL